MPAWLPSDNLVGTVFAALALAISIWNYFRTSEVADRQYALAFVQDVAKWAAEGFDMFRTIETRYDAAYSQDQHREWMGDARLVASSLLEKGALLFPGRLTYLLTDTSDHAVLAVLQELLIRLSEDRDTLRGTDSKFDAEKYGKLRQAFLDAVRAELQVDLRYSGAARVLRRRADHGLIVAKALGWREPGVAR